MANNGLRTCELSKWAIEDVGCLREFNPGQSKSPLCPNCRHRQYYWHAREKKRPGAARLYRGRLMLRSASMDLFLGVIGNSPTTADQLPGLTRRRRRG
jgi:hypothetical protein